MGSFAGALKHLLSLDLSEIRLKWIFDHVRNYGLAGTVMVAGFYLVKSGAVVSELPGAGIVLGTLLIALALGLFCLNILQPILAMAQYKVRAVPHFLVSVVLLLGGSELVWVIVERMKV